MTTRSQVWHMVPEQLKMFPGKICVILSLSPCVICLGQPATSFWAERSWLFEECCCLEGGRPAANPPLPWAVCPAPSQRHHRASSVVGPLGSYKSLWMLSAQTAHCPPSRDYCSLNEAARRRICNTGGKKEEEVCCPPTGVLLSKRTRPLANRNVNQ